MQSRDPGLLATSVDIAERVPFWAVLAIAMVAFIAFDLLAHIAVPSADRVADAGSVVIRHMLKTAGEILRFLVPISLLLGALIVRLRKGKRRASLNLTPVPAGETKNQSAQSPQCPRCASPMIQRTAKSGSRVGQAFWGCTRYPACKGTQLGPPLA